MKRRRSWFREAYYAAGDPAKYPEQLREGLRPWQPKKLYFSAPPPPPGAGWAAEDEARRGRLALAARRTAVKLTPANTNTYDALLGRTYAEIGADARSNHKCQGVGGLPALPGFNAGRGGRGGPADAAPAAPAVAAGVRPPLVPLLAVRSAAGYQLIDSTIPQQKEKTETSLFDGIDIRLEAHRSVCGPEPARRADLRDRRHCRRRQGRADSVRLRQRRRHRQPIEAGLAAIRALRAQLSSMGLDDAARYEIDFRLRIKERDYEDAVLAAHGLTFDAVADDGLVIAGQPVKLSLLAVNRGASDVSVTGVSIAGFDVPARLRAGRREEGCGLHLHVRGARPEKRPADHALLHTTTTGSTRRTRPFRFSIRVSRSAFPSRPRRSA